jgi:hypothetical protein
LIVDDTGKCRQWIFSFSSFPEVGKPGKLVKNIIILRVCERSRVWWWCMPVIPALGRLS